MNFPDMHCSILRKSSKMGSDCTVSVCMCSTKKLLLVRLMRKLFAQWHSVSGATFVFVGYFCFLYTSTCFDRHMCCRNISDVLKSPLPMGSFSLTVPEDAQNQSIHSWKTQNLECNGNAISYHMPTDHMVFDVFMRTSFLLIAENVVVPPSLF